MHELDNNDQNDEEREDIVPKIGQNSPLADRALVLTNGFNYVEC